MYIYILCVIFYNGYIYKKERVREREREQDKEIE
jgi:hypothetical protein